MINENLE
jgi:hypothetical protein